ncbi:MAG TPA: hypothetical protein VLL05_19560, partial [Terriglobales bacterium]|nr:hypothetical protein [Terriglobales bacterium]
MNVAIKFLLLVATSIALPTLPPKSATPSIKTTRDLVKYVGTYPCSNGLLQQPVLLSALKSVLGSDYELYREHMRLSGCGAIARRDGFLLLDISQL